jgi:hypothetical protein
VAASTTCGAKRSISRPTTMPPAVPPTWFMALIDAASASVKAEACRSSVGI